MRPCKSRELHGAGTDWGQRIIELSEVVASQKRLFCRWTDWWWGRGWVQPEIFGQKDVFSLIFFLGPSPPFFTLLHSALRPLWQRVDSLRCANPFDMGWIDSCWQDAPCHFVCCHLIGTPQFTLPLLFPYPRSLWLGSVWHQRRGYVYLRRVQNLLWGQRGSFSKGTSFSQITVRRVKTDRELALV